MKKFYYLHGSRSQKLIEQRLEQIASAIALTDETALLESHTLRVQLICRQLQALQRTLAQFEDRLAEVFRSHPDREIFESLPGAGPVLAPRLLASLGSERERYEDAASLSSFSGIAPVTKQSGGKHHVHRRYRCPLFLKQSFHEYARESILHSRWAAAHYWQQRQKGSGHHAAVRSLAFKWQRVIWKCWQTRTPYREEVYEAALRKTGSPLVARLDQIQLGKSPFKSTPPQSKTSCRITSEVTSATAAGNARSAARIAAKLPEPSDCPAGRRFAAALWLAHPSGSSVIAFECSALHARWCDLCPTCPRMPSSRLCWRNARHR